MGLFGEFFLDGFSTVTHGVGSVCNMSGKEVMTGAVGTAADYTSRVTRGSVDNAFRVGKEAGATVVPADKMVKGAGSVVSDFSATTMRNFHDVMFRFPHQWSRY